MTSTVELTAPEIPDLSDPRSFADDVPHAAFAAIRRLPGLYWQPTPVATVNGGFWAVTRFADIQAVEKAPEIFTSTRGAAYPLTQREPNAGPGISLIETDPPQHTRLRRAAAKGFAPRVVANFEPWIREIVRDVIGNVAGKNEFDYVQEFGRTIPAQVIATVVGVPREDRRQMVEWTLALFAATQLTEGLAQGEGTRGRIALPLGAMAEYAGRLQVVKREHPADDMATALTACVDRGEIDQTEFLGWMTIMMGAGFETTHTAISQAMRMYLENPEVREATDRGLDEGLSDRVVDEYLRLISPPMQMARTAVRDVEFLGQHISEGDVLVLYFIAANRDPAVFTDPDRFDPWRQEKETLAFGSGIHRCIGAPLAKLELQILLEELHSAGPRLRLNGTPRRGWSNFINQLNELPVARA